MEGLTVIVDGDLNKLIEDFGSDCRLRNMTAEGIRHYKSNLVTFSAFLKSRNLSFADVDKRVLKDFLQYIRFQRRVKEKTVENYFSAMSALYDYLIFEELLKTNPVPPLENVF